MTRRQYSNNATQATLTASIGATDTSFALTSFAGYPVVPFTATISRGEVDEEIVLITAVSSGTVTATRGYDGTTSKSHSAGATFLHTAIAKDFDEANDHANKSAGVHGLVGAVIGTSDTQTLSNKTLLSPVLSSPIVTGTAAMTGVAATTLTVTGATVLAGMTATSGSFGTLTVTGASTLAAVTASTLSITGATTLAGLTADSAHVTGASTLDGSLTVNGVLRLLNGGDVSLTSTGHALQIGPNGTTVGSVNTIWDGNEMAARVWNGSTYTAGGFGMTVSNLDISGTATAGAQGSGASSLTRKDYVDARVQLPDTGWKSVTYQNGWGTFSGTFPPARYRMHATGQVEVQGTVSGGTIGTVPVFTLPAGYRPSKQLIFMCVGNDDIARVDVLANGQVQIKIGSTGFWTSLNFTFYAEL